MYCRDCHRFWPSGAMICGTCRRSFGGRLCPKNHLSPATATCCITCGSRKLLQPARQLSMAGPLSMFAWIIGLLLLKFLLTNVSGLIGLVESGADMIGSFVIGQSLGQFLGCLTQAGVIVVLVWLALRHVFGRESRLVMGLERLAWQLVVVTWRTAVKLAKALFAWITPRSTTHKNEGKA